MPPAEPVAADAIAEVGDCLRQQRIADVLISQALDAAGGFDNLVTGVAVRQTGNDVRRYLNAGRGASFHARLPDRLGRFQRVEALFTEPV